jgi:uncharacterized protein YuzE
LIRLTYDREADAVYVYLSEKPYDHGKRLGNRRRIDYASDGTVVGIEFLYVSDGVDVSDLPEQEQISRLLEEQNLKVFA